jgi:RNA polymerase sigma-70 factor (ECF subfamily)
MIDWSAIVGQHGALVWKTAYRLLNHEADAADCFQRTFVSALELSRTEPIRHWPALLRRLATARALERIRQRLGERKHLGSLPEEPPVDRKAAEPGRNAQANELAADLRHALAGIDERQAQVFCLACLDDATYEEIAEQLGVTVNHVGVLLNRAKASLRERLRAHDPSLLRLEREVPS